MPWDMMNPPSVAMNWTDEEKQKCIAAANEMMDSGNGEQEAIFACIHAAGKSETQRMRDLSGVTLERKFQLDKSTINRDERSIDGVSISSTTPVMHRVQGQLVPVILRHSKDSIVLDGQITKMLWNHDPNQPIGRIENIRLDGEKTRGKFVFSRNQKAIEVFNDIADGFLDETSVSALPIDFEDDGENILVTRWKLGEGSVVTFGADPSVGIHRAKITHEGSQMTDETKSGSEAAEVKDDVLNIEDFKFNRQRNIKDGEKKGVKEERKRILEIRRVFAPHLARGAEYNDLMDECIDKGVPINRSIDALLEMLAGEHEPLAGEFIQSEHDGSMDRKTARDVSPARRGEVTAGATDMEKFIEGAQEAMLVKAGIITDKEKVKIIRANEFHSMSLSELPREYLRRAGDSVRGSKLEIVGKALTRDSIIGHGTSDFANLLANVANKSLQIGYEEAPETWQAWCRIGSIPDFRQASRPNLSTFGDLQIVYENGEYKYGTFSDLKEVLTLLTYGKLFSISRQAIINDDLNALSRIPQNMGRAAARKVGDLAYAVLTTGTSTLMGQDGIALFDASTHGNYVTSGGAPSVTTIEAAKVAMGTQTDPAGNTLNIRPAYLIVPLAKEGTAQVLQSAQYDPAGTAGTLTPNTVQGTFTVVSDPRLDAFNASGWFMAANPSMHETVEVAFLDGNQTPFMEQKQGWSQDGTEFKVRIDAVAAPLDYRGLYYNDGVT